MPDLETAEEPKSTNNPMGLPGYIPGVPNAADFDFDNRDDKDKASHLLFDPLKNPRFNEYSVRKILTAMETPTVQAQLEVELSSHDWG